MNTFTISNFSLFFSYRFEDLKHKNFDKFKNLLLSLFLTIVLIIIVVAVIIFPLDLFITKYLGFESIRSLIHSSQEKIQLIPVYIIVFIVPLMEELLFRLSLKVNRLNASIFIGVLCYLLLGGSVSKFDFHNNFYLYCSAGSILLSILTYYSLSSKILNLINEKIKYLVVISILLFGLVHVSNIKVLHWQLTFFYPFFVLPQMIMGYFITNLRLKYGFFWGLLFHVLINAFSMLF